MGCHRWGLQYRRDPMPGPPVKPDQGFDGFQLAKEESAGSNHVVLCLAQCCEQALGGAGSCRDSQPSRQVLISGPDLVAEGQFD